MFNQMTACIVRDNADYKYQEYMAKIILAIEKGEYRDENLHIIRTNAILNIYEQRKYKIVHSLKVFYKDNTCKSGYRLEDL